MPIQQKSPTKSKQKVQAKSPAKAQQKAPVKSLAKSAVQAINFETGQIWEMAESNLRIGLIGKTLVHYKHYRGASPRASVSLANKGELAQFLIKNKAVLGATERANGSTVQ